MSRRERLLTFTPASGGGLLGDLQALFWSERRVTRGTTFEAPETAERHRSRVLRGLFLGGLGHGRHDGGRDLVNIFIFFLA